MAKSIDFENAKFVVIGVGLTGTSIINYLRAQQAQILRVLDTRINPPPYTFPYPLHSGPLDFKLLADADVIVISPGISIYEPVLLTARQAGIKIIGDIELFALAVRDWPMKIIGITGSNGKTTVASLCAFLAQSVGIKTLLAGNIGLPVLDAMRECQTTASLLDTSVSELPNSLKRDACYPELCVLELSSFQLETTYSLSLSSATVLNICQDHLDRYRDLLEYAYIKSAIFNNADHQVLNADDSLTMAMKRTNLSQSFFGTSTALEQQFIVKENQLGKGDSNYFLRKTADEIFLNIGGSDYLACSKLQLEGEHNYLNCLASLALLAASGYAPEDFKDALTKFKGLAHRMERVTEYAGVLYLEDSKGTNVGAVVAGVSGINRPVHLILGGDGKGQDFTPLRSLVINKCKSVALIGKDAELLAHTLTGIDDVQYYSSLELAVSACVKKAQAGDAVILSPACASWDMFSDYKERAKVYNAAVYAALESYQRSAAATMVEENKLVSQES